jgi:hypothetical protein
VKAPPEILPPPVIVAERDRLINWPNFMRAWRPILDRLCETTVWSQLSRRDPLIARTQLIEQSPKWCMEGMPDKKWSDRDIALQVVFLNAFSLTISGMQTITPAEKKRLVDSYREQARRLRNEAAWFRGLLQGEASEAAEHGRAVLRAAAWCETEADEMVSRDDPNHPLHDDRLVVDRHQVPAHVRAYCIQLAEVTRLLYGDVLRGTVAAIATKALGLRVSVTAANVRYWCENKGT